MVRPASEAEVEILALQLKRIGKLDILQRPTPRRSLLIFRTVIHPNAQISLRLAPELERINIPAVQFARLPLKRRETAHHCVDAAEVLGMIEGDRSNPAR